MLPLLACVIGSLVTHRIAYRGGYEDGYNSGLQQGIGQGSFHKSVAFLAALEPLREGDISRAIHIMERVCFTSAHTFYKDPTPEYLDDATVKQVARGLSQYRATYRTNSADWDDAEQKLEIELAKIE